MNVPILKSVWFCALLQLQDKLAVKEKELESRLVDAELMQTQLDARACEKAGGTLWRGERLGERGQTLGLWEGWRYV